jgi:cbb3-type cytochrome oxidase maturation protein
MNVVFGLIPFMLLIGFIVVLVFIRMAKTGHFDDLDGAANSIFMDDGPDDPRDFNQPKKSLEGENQSAEAELDKK